jgi:hypothetical protein
LSVMWDGSTNTCGKPWVVRDAETGVSWVLHSWNRGDDHEPQIINPRSEDTRRASEPERFVDPSSGAEFGKFASASARRISL